MAIFNTIGRILIYQSIFISFYFRFTDLNKSSYALKDNIFTLLNGFNIQVPALENLLDQPVLVFQAFMGICIFSAILGLLRVRLFQVLSALLVLLDVFINYSPLTTGNKITSPFGVKSELLLGVGIALAILVDCTSSCNTESGNNNNNSEVTSSDDVKSNGNSNTNTRDARPNSSKKKTMH